MSLEATYYCDCQFYYYFLQIICVKKKVGEKHKHKHFRMKSKCVGKSNVHRLCTQIVFLYYLESSNKICKMSIK